MKSRLFFFAAMLSLAPVILRAQSPLEADAVAFRYDSTHAQVEIDYGVLERALAFKQFDGVWTSYTDAKAEIWQNGRVTQERNIHDTVRCSCTQAQLDSAGANKLLGATAFAVPYWDTTGTFPKRRGTDSYGTPVFDTFLIREGTATAAFLWRSGEKDGRSVFDTIVIPLILPVPDTAKFALGGIELASQLEKSSGQTSPFEKAGYIVTPNPSAIFGENYTKLYYYTELYVPQAAVDAAQSVDVVTSVIDPGGMSILSSTEKVPLAGATIPIILGLDVDGLASDSYKLRIQVKNQDAIAAEAEKSFYYTSDIKLSEAAPVASNSTMAADSILFAGSDFAKLTAAAADELIEQSMYWGDDADKTAAKKLGTLEDKQQFLFSFWRGQDSKLHTAQPLDAYRSFMTRVSEANAKFTYQKTPGWKSSRGRVLIMYGPPAVVDNEPFVAGYKPYLVWQYDQNQALRLRAGNRAEFDFVDRMGGGNYSLVNSNVIGENYDPNWMTTEALETAHY